MKSKSGLSMVLIWLVLAVGFSSLVGSLAVADTARVDVIIGFVAMPDVELLKQHGGEVRSVYTIITAACASLPERAIEPLRRNPKIAYIHENGKVEALGQTLPWGIDRIKAPQAWAESMGSGVNISIVDTGIGPHDDLVVWGGYDYVNGDADPSDDNGHGTHVAGTVAALDNDFGVVGAAPKAYLYAVKVLDSGGSGTLDWVIKGIQWSIGNDMQIISMSLGTSTDYQALRDAVDAAYGQGLLLVAAAGNSGNPAGRGDNVGYPAKYDSVIAVAATDQNDKRASWSSTGPAVELAAPGVNIYSTWTGNTYKTASGTSMACPHVTGAAALVWAVNPGLSNVDVRGILQQTAEDLGLPANQQGYGLVRADAAVAMAKQTEPPATGSVNGTVTDGTNPINGATVVVEGTTLSATTDGNGYYLLENVPVGDQQVTASADGYYSQTATVGVVGDDTVTQDFALEAITEETMYVKSITFAEKRYGPGGSFVDLMVTVEVLRSSDDQPVSGARVKMNLKHEKGSWNFAGDTNSNGKVTFTLKRAYTGDYTATVTEVTHSVYVWDKTKGVTLAKYTVS